jgi:hypothetical protein
MELSTFITGVNHGEMKQSSSVATGGASKRFDKNFPNSEEINYNFAKLDDMILVSYYRF